MVHFLSRPEGEASKVHLETNAGVFESWPQSGMPFQLQTRVSSGSSGATPKPRRAPGPRPRAPEVRAKEKPGVRGAAEREAKAREGPRLRPDQPQAGSIG